MQVKQGFSSNILVLVKRAFYSNFSDNNSFDLNSQLLNTSEYQYSPLLYTTHFIQWVLQNLFS